MNSRTLHPRKAQRRFLELIETTTAAANDDFYNQTDNQERPRASIAEQ